MSDIKYLQFQRWGFSDEVKELVDRADRGTVKFKRWEFFPFDKMMFHYKDFQHFPAFCNRAVDIAQVLEEDGSTIVCCWDPSTKMVWYRRDSRINGFEIGMSREIAKRLIPDDNHLCPFSHLLHRMDDDSEELDMENIPIMCANDDLRKLANDIVMVRESLKQQRS